MRKNLLLLFGSLILGFCIAEGAARAFNVQVPVNPRAQSHPVLGWISHPNSINTHTWYERPVEIRINAQGFRSPDIELHKDPNTRRILVVGDSFTEARQVRFEEIFHQQLQHLLEKDSQQKWEVIAMGVGGWGTAQEYLALQHFGLQLDPDIVIMQFFMNDICNNAIEAADICMVSPPNRPYMIERSGALQQTSLQPIRNRIRRYCRTCAVIEHAILIANIYRHTGHMQALRWQDIKVYQDQKSQATREAQNIPVLAEFYAYAQPKDQLPAIEAGWSVTEQIYLAIAKELSQKNIKLLVAVIPHPSAILQTDWQREVQPLTDLQRDYIEQRLQTLFTELSIPSVMMLPIFEQHAKEVLPYLGGHLNLAGHRYMAEVLAQTISVWVSKQAMLR